MEKALAETTALLVLRTYRRWFRERQGQPDKRPEATD